MQIIDFFRDTTYTCHKFPFGPQIQGILVSFRLQDLGTSEGTGYGCLQYALDLCGVFEVVSDAAVHLRETTVRRPQCNAKDIAMAVDERMKNG